MNIFSLAPKELTNSAVWAWIIQSLVEGENNGPRCKIARNMFQLMDIVPPSTNDIRELVTEKTMKTLYRDRRVIDKQSGRIDVFLRVSGKNPYVLLIENKVAEMEKEIPGLLKQIEHYHSFYEQVSKVDPTYCSTVYPAYFGYEIDTAEQLIELATKKKSPIMRSLITFPLDKMLKAFANTGFESDPLLKDFHGWLSSREKFINFRANARRKKNVNIGDVIDASGPLGFGHLLNRFIDGMKNCKKVNSQINRRSVDVRNINFYKGSSTPITLRWYYDSGPNGLYVGVHRNIESMLGLRLDRKKMPDGFAFEGNYDWDWGYLRTINDVDTFWAAIN